MDTTSAKKAALKAIGDINEVLSGLTDGLSTPGERALARSLVLRHLAEARGEVPVLETLRAARRRDVVEMLESGMQVKEVAEALGMDPSRVRQLRDAEREGPSRLARRKTPARRDDAAQEGSAA